MTSAWKWWIAIVLFLATVLTYLDRPDPVALRTDDLPGVPALERGVWAAGGGLPLGLRVRPRAGRLPGRPRFPAADLCGRGQPVVDGGSGGRLHLRWPATAATRAVLGVGEAFNWPCTTRIIADLLPPADRGLGSGIFNSGAAVGSLIAPLIITPLALHFGWRKAFFTIGAVGFFWVFLWLGNDPQSVGAASFAGQCRPSAGPRPSPQAGVLARLGQWAREVLLHPAFWMLLVMGLSVNPCWYFLNEWIPKYMHDQRGLGYLTAGLVTIPIFVGADLGNLLSGALIKVLTLRGWSLRKARGTTLTLAALLVAPTGLLGLVDDTWLVVAILGLAGMGITSFVANYTACSQDFSFANVGIVSGIMGMSCNVFSASVNPWIGRYVDATGKYTLIFILMGILPVLSLGMVLFSMPPSTARKHHGGRPDQRCAAPGVTCRA